MNFQKRYNGMVILDDKKFNEEWEVRISDKKIIPADKIRIIIHEDLYIAVAYYGEENEYIIHHSRDVYSLVCMLSAMSRKKIKHKTETAG